MTLNLGNIPLGTGPAANVANVEATIQRSMVRLQACLPPSEFAKLQGRLTQIQDAFLRMPQGGPPDMSGSYAQGGDVLAQAMALQKGSTAVADQSADVQVQVARSLNRNKGMMAQNMDPARAQADALVKAGIDPNAALSAARGSQSGSDASSEARRQALEDSGIPINPSNPVQRMEQIKRDNLAADNAAAERAADERRRQQNEDNAKANNS